MLHPPSAERLRVFLSQNHILLAGKRIDCTYISYSFPSRKVSVFRPPCIRIVVIYAIVSLYVLYVNLSRLFCYIYYAIVIYIKLTFNTNSDILRMQSLLYKMGILAAVYRLQHASKHGCNNSRKPVTFGQFSVTNTLETAESRLFPPYYMLTGKNSA